MAAVRSMDEVARMKAGKDTTLRGLDSLKH